MNEFYAGQNDVSILSYHVELSEDFNILTCLLHDMKYFKFFIMPRVVKWTHYYIKNFNWNFRLKYIFLNIKVLLFLAEIILKRVEFRRLSIM